MLLRRIIYVLGVSFLFVKSLPVHSQGNILPTREQAAWADAEMGVIIHLDINIYAPESFDYSDKRTLPDLAIFNPSQLNTDQWIRTAKAMGARYALLTVKHGTGFCLWPSSINSYNVGHTAWRHGKADILLDFITSCKKYGIQPGLYYNTNVNTYYKGTPASSQTDSSRKAYKVAVLGQLKELWTNYGKFFEIWFDGGLSTNKEDGIQNEVVDMIRQRQPQAILFQGPLATKNIIRWIGNEDGIAAYPQWSRTNENTASDGLEKIDNIHGSPDGKIWCPGESDFPIRRNKAWNGGWLWKAGQEDYLFTVKELMDKYFHSVGTNTNMLVGMVIDTSGLVPKADSLVFDSLGHAIHSLTDNEVAVRKNISGVTAVIAFKHPQKVNGLMLQENISAGENIRSYTVSCLVKHKWLKVAEGQSVGHKRLDWFTPVITSKLKLSVNAYSGPVQIKKMVVLNDLK